MTNHQSAIVAPVPSLARASSYALEPGANANSLLVELVKHALGDEVVGLGRALVSAAGADVPGLRDFPALTNQGIAVPSTPAALWIFMRDDDRGRLVHRSRAWNERLRPWLRPEAVLDTFKYQDSRDLSGYVDGTENPEGEKALAAAISTADGLAGSSFVAVQKWVHDLAALSPLSQAERDDLIGRRQADSEEFDEAPGSAHVKRAAQESFSPEAFMLRRSMPWADSTGEGLLFVAFGKSFDAFDAVLHRMIGMEDGITDGLFCFTRPVDGAYYWCPPVVDGRLDLRGLRRD
jgi:putative iron-dependent peroxidase